MLSFVPRTRREMGAESTRATGLPLGLLRYLNLGSLVALSAALTGLTLVIGPSMGPPAALTLPVLLGAMSLRLGAVRALLAAVALCLLVEIVVLGVGVEHVRPGTVVLVLVSGAIAHALASAREQLGVPGVRGDSMLADLRDRLLSQGELPGLPVPWRAESAIAASGGFAFSGDFLVSRRTDAGRLLEVSLVDVSGKGMAAGTRALQLCGALGGLIGAVPSGEFLRWANSYVATQEWDEGFATAVHVAIDLTTGDYTISSAGHPPAAHFAAGSGSWRLATAEGPALGLLPEWDYQVEKGFLGPGDALLLFTDGLVEVPGRDLTVGIDRLLGAATELVVRGFAGGPTHLLRSVDTGQKDDRAVVLIWRQ